MLFVLLPEVIHPLMMVQEYLAPIPPLATEAALPDEPEHIEAAAVIDTTRYGAMVTTLLPEELLHPAPLVTVTEMVTEPAAPDVNVILPVLLPEVMVPLPMVHA
jgi:hypothetical protein